MACILLRRWTVVNVDLFTSTFFESGIFDGGLGIENILRFNYSVPFGMLP